MAIELQAKANSSEGNLFVCALCKMGYVYKIVVQQNTLRLACENQGCLDLTIGNVNA